MNSIYTFLFLGVAACCLICMICFGCCIIIVPALIIIFVFSLLYAQGTSLAAIMPPVGFLAAYTFYQNGNLNIKVAAMIATGFILGAYLGAKTNYAIKKEVMEKVFAVLLIIVAVRMLLKNN